VLGTDLIIAEKGDLCVLRNTSENSAISGDFSAMNLITGSFSFEFDRCFNN